MNMTLRDKQGRFIRTIPHWSLVAFNAGWVRTDGRFAVYFPEHPRSDNEGYVLRAIVAYETYTGVIVDSAYAVHHKNGDRLDDSKENLVRMLFGEHSRLHNLKLQKQIEFTCCMCGKTFRRSLWRTKNKSEDSYSYCSKSCYNSRLYSNPKAGRHISESLKKAYREGRR